jgi:hypothetical protein
MYQKYCYITHNKAINDEPDLFSQEVSQLSYESAHSNIPNIVEYFS